MPKRFDLAVKIALGVCVALVALQAVRLAGRIRTVQTLSVPALPTWSGASTNSVAGTNGIRSGTNSVASTNVIKSGTNSSSVSKGGVSNAVSAAFASTNGTSASGTTATTQSNKSGSVTSAKATTNQTKSVSSATNTSLAKLGTNSASTNGIISGTSTNGTSSAKVQGGIKKGPMQMAGMGKKGADVPPAVKSRIDRITGSEILGMVPHPMPMGLLGIAGDNAFLRSPEGQTGMVKEGAELGTLKLLKVGINRVLVEHEGQKQELMIYSGLGGETLMPKEEKKPNESTKKTP